MFSLVFLWGINFKCRRGFWKPVIHENAYWNFFKKKLPTFKKPATRIKRKNEKKVIKKMIYKSVRLNLFSEKASGTIAHMDNPIKDIIIPVLVSKNSRNTAPV